MRMRLWHEAILPYLPRAQLLGQHRECCALRGLSWGRRYAVVDYVFTHSRERLAVYHARVMREMQRRGYRVEDCWRAPGYRGQRCASFVPDREKMARLENRYPVYAEHDTAYFRACVENLRRNGRGDFIRRSEADGCEQERNDSGTVRLANDRYLRR